LGYLLNKLSDTTIHSLTRQACAAYIGSFVSRATFITPEKIKDTLSVLVGRIHDYLDKLGSSVRPDAEIHGLFYSICQAIFYIICFHRNTLFQGVAGRNFFERLDFDRIASSHLNPFKFCLPTIVMEFSKISSSMGLDTCSHVAKQNESIILPTRSTLGGVNQMDSFFPFDPYLLKNSAKYINNVYRIWEQVKEPEKEVEVEVDVEAEQEEVESVEEFSEHRLSGSIQAMSITPVKPLDLEFHFQNSLEV